MRLLWLHKPHPCKTCGVTLHIAYPTCATDACRLPWRRKAENLRRQTRNEQIDAESRCRACKKRLSVAVLATGYKACTPCRKKEATRKRTAAREAAFASYCEALALARAERTIARKEKEAEKRDQEAREKVEQMFPSPPTVDEEGNTVYEDV